VDLSHFEIPNPSSQYSGSKGIARVLNCKFVDEGTLNCGVFHQTLSFPPIPIIIASRTLTLTLWHRTSFLLMASFFSLTTPCGVALGLGIRSGYNDNSPTALAVSGVFDSISAGILVYMALVRTL